MFGVGLDDLEEAVVTKFVVDADGGGVRACAFAAVDKGNAHGRAWLIAICTGSVPEEYWDVACDVADVEVEDEPLSDDSLSDVSLSESASVDVESALELDASTFVTAACRLDESLRRFGAGVGGIEGCRGGAGEGERMSMISCLTETGEARRRFLGTDVGLEDVEGPAVEAAALKEDATAGEDSPMAGDGNFDGEAGRARGASPLQRLFNKK